MKSLIKTTLFAAFLFVIALNSSRVSKECIETYNECVAFLASNASVPTNF